MGDTGYVGDVTKWRRKPPRRDTMYDAVGYVRQSAHRNRLFNLAQGTKSISGDEKNWKQNTGYDMRRNGQGGPQDFGWGGQYPLAA